MDSMQSEATSYTPVHHLLPTPSSLSHARANLITTLPTHGHGSTHIAKHIETDIVPAFENHNKSPHYYGFVTGGTTPAALHADHIAVDADQTAQVYLPNETIAVEVEDAAMRMLCDIFDLDQAEWRHRILTTGATASNVMGLAMGRDFVIQSAAAKRPGHDQDVVSVAELGLRDAMEVAGLEEIQVLTTVPHSSLRKAAAVVGIGRSHIHDVGRKDAPHRFDFDLLEQALSSPKKASILVISAAEVNTGFFATTGEEMTRIRALCTLHGTWLHVDAAFGLLARCLPPSDPSLEKITSGVANLHLADSIASDAHKLLNVPYDSGIFFSRHLTLATSVFQNTAAAYLTPTSSSTTQRNADPNAPPHLPSPLNVGMENSRRLRALPLYATLASYGLHSHRQMLRRQIHLARSIATYIQTSAYYDLIPLNVSLDEIYIIVLFRAKEEKWREGLVEAINQSRRVYVSGTVWEGQRAGRFAVGSWMVDGEREVEVVKEILEEVGRGFVGEG